MKKSDSVLLNLFIRDKKKKPLATHSTALSIDVTDFEKEKIINYICTEMNLTPGAVVSKGRRRWFLFENKCNIISNVISWLF